MSLVTANGYGVVACDFIKPISRAWHVDMTVATNDPSKINGAVTININNALTLKGTAKVDDVYLDTVRARVVAGAGGLPTVATPKHYRQATARVILGDLLTSAGETMSSTADVGILGTVLASWTTLAMPIGDAIALLARKLGASWRMLADGTLWIGSETWPDSGLAYTLEHDDKAHQQLVIGSEAPTLMPGQSLSGRRVSYVEDHVDASSVRSTVWIATPTSYDRLRDGTVAVTRSAAPENIYFAPYRCRVVAQSSSTALELLPDDPRLPAAGLTSVPLRNGLPGCTSQVAPGAYVLLGWMNGDPSAPFCSLWEGGESLLSLQLGGNDPLITKADFTALITAITAMATAGNTGGPLSFTAPPAYGSTRIGAGR